MTGSSAAIIRFRFGGAVCAYSGGFPKPPIHAGDRSMSPMTDRIVTRSGIEEATVFHLNPERCGAAPLFRGHPADDGDAALRGAGHLRVIARVAVDSRVRRSHARAREPVHAYDNTLTRNLETKALEGTARTAPQPGLNLGFGRARRVSHSAH